MRTDYTLLCTPRPPSLDHVELPAAASRPAPRITLLQVAIAVPVWAAVLYAWLDAGWGIAIVIPVASALVLLAAQGEPATRE